MKTRLGLIAAVLMCGSFVRAAETARPSVEVVFVIDTTSSMGGLIEGAKQRIWAIANEIAKGRPAPKVKMGLVAFRDKGDSYVTKVFDLSENLDNTYKDLLSLSAEGGGDGPEHVIAGARRRGREDRVEQGLEDLQGRLPGRRRAAARGLPGLADARLGPAEGGAPRLDRELRAVRQRRRDDGRVQPYLPHGRGAPAAGSSGRRHGRDGDSVR